MFREGQYLEVIKIFIPSRSTCNIHLLFDNLCEMSGKRHSYLKCGNRVIASEGCLATAIVTIKEKTVEYKKRKITTNKWLDLQDWASLYGIIRKAIIRNNESRSQGKIETTERRKSTRHLEVTYKFEAAEFPEDRTSLPTIRVSVSAPRKSSGSSNRRKVKEDVDDVKKYEKRTNDESNGAQLSENESFMCDNYSLEEYVPPEIASNTKASVDLKYVPSRKSMLMRMRCSSDENKYTPTSGNKISPASNGGHTEVSYIPNAISSLKKPVHERYDPCGALTTSLSETYVPSSKGARSKVEEYQPDFATKTMKFDDSYVPSSTYAPSDREESRKRSRKSRDPTSIKSSSSRSLISKVPKREL